MIAEKRKLFFSFVHPSIIVVLVYCTYRPPKDTRVIVAEVDMKLLLSDLELVYTLCCWYVVADVLTARIGPHTGSHLQLYVLHARGNMYVMSTCMHIRLVMGILYQT